MQETNKNPWKVISATVLVLVVASYGLFKYVKKDSSVSVTEPITNTTETVVPERNSIYKDGTYSAVGAYVSPGGDESINVSLTLKGGVIVDSNVVSNATRDETKRYQGRFISGYKALVIGKKLDEVNLTKVSGSSLTPKGWNDAISQIKTQAKA